MTDKERLDAQQALLYKLRRLFTSGEKETYTKQEIAEMLDQFAAARGGD